MLSVIVDARGAGDRLAGLLAALTPAAVEGLVREVAVVAPEDPELADALCQATGASMAADLGAALQRAKGEWLLVLPAAIRLREGWVERLRDALADGPKPARLRGIGGGSVFAASPEGVLIERRRAAGLAQPDLKRLRRAVGAGGRRLS